MHRRDFLAGLGAASLAGWWGPGLRFRPPTGLGVQLYTVRAEMRRDLEATLARVAELGYREVEFAGYFGRTPADLRALLDRTGLVAPSSHIQVPLLGDRWDETLDAAARLGHRQLVLAWLPPAQRSTLDDYRRLSDRLNEAGERCRAVGLTMGYHNHDFEFVAQEGIVPFDLMVERTDPALLQFQLDAYWVAKGAGPDSVLRYVTALGSRVTSIHAKDMDASGQMMDPGQGVLDVAAVLRAGPAIRHVFVEHDSPADPWVTLRAGVDAWGSVVTAG